jgi:hypothetical protein
VCQYGGVQVCDHLDVREATPERRCKSTWKTWSVGVGGCIKASIYQLGVTRTVQLPRSVSSVSAACSSYAKEGGMVQLKPCDLSRAGAPSR